METMLSGLSELPGILAYPPVLSLADVPEMKGQFAYVVRGYPETGLSIVIKRSPQSDSVRILVGDFNGTNITVGDVMDERVAKFVSKDVPVLIGMMKCLKIDQAIYYLAATGPDFTLVDVRLSLDKFCGPGMVRDLFSKVLRTQEVIKIISLDEPTLNAIQAGSGEYAGPLVLKCSMFKTITRERDMLPLYAKIRHEVINAT